jgi:hypothetical protein
VGRIPGNSRFDEAAINVTHQPRGHSRRSTNIQIVGIVIGKIGFEKENEPKSATIL